MASFASGFTSHLVQIKRDRVLVSKQQFGSLLILSSFNIQQQGVSTFFVIQGGKKRVRKVRDIIRI